MDSVEVTVVVIDVVCVTVLLVEAVDEPVVNKDADGVLLAVDDAVELADVEYIAHVPQATGHSRVTSTSAPVLTLTTWLPSHLPFILNPMQAGGSNLPSQSRLVVAVVDAVVVSVEVAVVFWHAPHIPGHFALTSKNPK